MKYAVKGMCVAIAMAFISVVTMSFTAVAPKCGSSALQTDDAITASVERNAESGVNFYLINSSSETIHVTYNVTNSENVDLKDTGAGGIIDIGPDTKVLVVQAIVAGPGEWYSGDIHFEWQPN